MDVEAASFDIVEGKESRTRIQDDIRQRQKQHLEMLEEKEKNARVSRLQHSIAWLLSDEKVQDTEYERTSKRRHDGTCDWVLKETQLTNWNMDDSKRPCLWLHGKPGSGILISCLIILPSLIPSVSQSRKKCHVFISHSNSQRPTKSYFVLLLL